MSTTTTTTALGEPKGATMDNFMNMTKEAGHTPEIQRLMDLHAAYNDAMDGQLILAPINLEEPGKRILDCGTADGTWLRSVRSSTPAASHHHYFGTDIEAELFPPTNHRDGITYIQHSFQDPWPLHLQQTFDLVHMRGSLAGASPHPPSRIIKNLATLPRPGGWIQLMEMNAFDPPRAGNGPAMADFARLAAEVWDGIGVGDFANGLGAMLREGAGMRDVGERRFVVELGKRAKEEGGLRARSVNGVAAPVGPIAAVARDLRTSFSGEELDGLPGRVRAELEDQGGRVEMIVAWGQRPLEG
ncbi:hypothetical protein XANCAGTX0491_006649 [Xanthoria calcicola]